MDDEAVYEKQKSRNSAPVERQSGPKRKCVPGNARNGTKYFFSKNFVGKRNVSPENSETIRPGAGWHKTEVEPGTRISYLPTIEARP